MAIGVLSTQSPQQEEAQPDNANGHHDQVGANDYEQQRRCLADVDGQPDIGKIERRLVDHGYAQHGGEGQGQVGVDSVVVENGRDGPPHGDGR